MAQTIEHLQGQIMSLTNQLEKTIQQSNLKIMTLQRMIHHKDQLLSEINDRLNHQTQELAASQLKIKQIQAFLKERNSSFMEKQVKCLQLQAEIKKVAKAKNQEHQHKLQELINVIRSQDAELKLSLDDHEYFISQTQVFKQQYQMISLERNLLREYNEELLTQVEQLQDINSKLGQRLQQFSTELRLQNQQSNDMLCQIEYMIENTEQSA